MGERSGRAGGVPVWSDLGVIMVLVADQQRLFSSSLAAALAELAELAVLDERPTTGHEAIKAVEVWRPDVALLDFWMQGPESTRQIRHKAPECKVMLLSWMHAPGQVQEAVSAGAVGFLPKSLGLADVAEAIRRAQAGESPVFAKQLSKLVQTIGVRHERAEDFSRRLKDLSPREFQILLLLSRGHLIQEVASELKITPATVTAHINRILKKTGARSHAEVLAQARAAGLIQT